MFQIYSKLLKYVNRRDSLELILNLNQQEIRFSGRVLDTPTETTVELEVPHSLRNFLLPLENMPLVIIGRWSAIGIIEVAGTLIEATQALNHLSIIITPGKELKQVQRRQYFRLPLLRPLHLLDSTQSIMKGYTQDVSAGGLRCILGESLNIGSVINVSFELNKQPIELKGTILDTSKSPEEENQYIHRIEFTHITEKSRSQLLSSIFTEQSRIKRIRI